MAHHQSPLAVIVKGALAGAAGSAVMSAFVERAPQLLGQVGMRPTAAAASPGDEERMSTDSVQAANGALHWAYGAAWGAYFAVLQSTFRPSSIIHGTFLGGLMTFAATKGIPKLGLGPAPRDREELVLSASSHVVFGIATAIVYRILNLGRRG